VSDAANQLEKLYATVRATLDAVEKSYRAPIEAARVVNNRRVLEMVETTSNITQQLEDSLRPAREAVSRVQKLSAAATAIDWTSLLPQPRWTLDFGRMWGTWQRDLLRSFEVANAANLAFEQVGHAARGMVLFQEAQEHVWRSLFKPMQLSFLFAEINEELLRRAVASVSVRDELEAEVNLPEGPRPAEPRTLDTERKLALFALFVAVLVVAGYMKPDEGWELLGLLVMLMSLLAAPRR